MACVRRAVDTTPVALPCAMASSSSVVDALPLPVAGQLVMAALTFVTGSLLGARAMVLPSMDSTSLRVFTPVM